MDREVMKNKTVEHINAEVEVISGNARDTYYEVMLVWLPLAREWWVVVQSPTIAAWRFNHAFTMAYLKDNLGMFSVTDAYYVGILIEDATGLKFLDREDFDEVAL